MADITIKARDTWPPRPIQLKEKTEQGERPVDLTGAVSVKLHIVKKDKSVRVMNGDCEIPSGTRKDGWITWTPEPGDTDIPGEYDGEADINFGPGKDQTVPNLGYIDILIVPSLDPED